MQAESLSNMVIKKVASVHTIFTPSGTRSKMVNRPRCAIGLKFEGETVYETKNRRVVSDASHPVLLPAGATYTWECTKEGHYITLELEFEGACPFSQPVSFPIKSGEKLLALMQRAERRRNEKTPFSEMESIRDAYDILLWLLRAVKETYLPTKTEQKIAPALTFLAQNYAYGVKNEQLAALCGISVVYFRKLFTRVTGTSPIAYAHALRIEKAKEMLTSDFGTIENVARALGYASLYDFSRDFKRRVGSSPSEYAKENRVWHL